MEKGLHPSDQAWAACCITLLRLVHTNAEILEEICFSPDKLRI